MSASAERIPAVIEYCCVARRWRPHSILTTRGETWDAEWSRALQTSLVTLSGTAGRLADQYLVCPVVPRTPPVAIWAADGITLVRDVWRGDDLRRAPVRTPRALLRLGYVRLRRLPADPFADAIECGRIVRCVVCRDFFDDADACAHLDWSSQFGGAFGVGLGDDETETSTFKASLAALFGHLGVERVRELRGDLPGGWGSRLRDLESEYDDCEAACVYLRTLASAPRRLVRAMRKRIDHWLATASAKGSPSP